MGFFRHGIFLGTDYTDFLSENKGASLRVIRVIRASFFFLRALFFFLRALFFFLRALFFLRAYLIAFPV